MTRAEALAEARRRWGPDAAVRRLRTGGFVVRSEPIRHLGPPPVHRGMGSSWEAAFADAEAGENNALDKAALVYREHRDDDLRDAGKGGAE